MMTVKKDIALPPVSEADLEEIDFSTSRNSKSLSAMVAAKKSINNSHTPSPLQQQVLARSPSISSNNSNHSTTSSSQAQFVILLDKTPQNLTPTQRLQLRKLQLNNSISKFKSDDTNISLPVNRSIHQSKSLSRTANRANNVDVVIDDQDEEIDVADVQFLMALFNAPLSQQFTSISHREKFLFDNTERKSSLTNSDSTRSSSILSQDSFNETSSSVSDYEDVSFAFYKSVNSSFSSLEFSSISRDAQELTLLFNKDESVQIAEESACRQQMLNSFRKVPSPQTSTASPNPLQSYSSSRPLARNHSVSRPQAPRQNLPPLPPSQSQVGRSSSVSKYYTFTRPTWLPPKSSYDKRKHQKESEDILLNAMKIEAEQLRKKLIQLQTIKKQKLKDLKVWEALTALPTMEDYEEKLSSVKSFDGMYWRGIPESVRGKVWWRNLNSKFKFYPNGKKDAHMNKFNVQFCEYYFQMYDSVVLPNVKQLEKLAREHNQMKVIVDQYEGHGVRTVKRSLYLDAKSAETKAAQKLKTLQNIHISDCNNMKLSTLKSLYDTITTDLLDVYPDLNHFQNFDIIQKLTKIITCFVLYLHQNSGSQDDNITKFYFAGLKNLVAVFQFNFKNTYKTFVTICQFFDDHIPSLLLNLRVLEDKAAQALLLDSFSNLYLNAFEQHFMKNLERLYIHFKVVHLKPIDYLPNLILGLFTDLLNFELSNHILDIYVFECGKFDEFVTRLILGFFTQIGHKLYGSRDEILKTLKGLDFKVDGNDDIYRYFNVGYEHDFIETIRSVKI